MSKLVLTAAMVLGLAGMTLAQTGNQASVTVTATVIEAVSITGSAALDFGNIVQGASKTVDPASAGAQLTVTGNSGSSITITWNTDAMLANSNGDKISFSPSLYGSETAFGTGGDLLTNGHSATISSSQSYYISVGGSINTTGAAVGDYSTANTSNGGVPLTVTVTY